MGTTYTILLALLNCFRIRNQAISYESFEIDVAQTWRYQC